MKPQSNHPSIPYHINVKIVHMHMQMFSLPGGMGIIAFLYSSYFKIYLVYYSTQL